MNNDNMKTIDLEQRKGAEQINMMSKMYNMKQNNNTYMNNSNQSSEIGEVEEEDKYKANLCKETIDFFKGKNKYYMSNNEKKKFNLEFPIEFSKSKDAPKDLGSFMRIANPPTLFVDFSDNQSFEKELEMNELSNLIAEKNEIIRRYERQLQDAEKTIKDFTGKLKEKAKTLTYYKSLEIDNDNQLKELKEKKNTLIQSLPGKKPDDHKKQLTIKEYRDLKFEQEIPDEAIITKTLQKDLMDYSEYIKAEINQRKVFVMKLVQNIQACVNEISEDYEVKLYGSYATGLCLPWSDLDVVLVNKKGLQQPMLNLKAFCEVLSTKNWVYVIKLIENTSIPIVKINSTDEYNNMKIDISVQSEKHYGLKCVELVNSYLKEYIVLEPLILALKTILKNANLNDPYRGGLSSYGLILMVVSFIQSKIDSNTYPEGEDLIGKTFYGFLNHYGIYFDYNNYVILTYPINDIDKDLVDPTPNFNFGPNMHELIIVDPLNKQNNVAKSTHQFMNMKMAFMIAFMVTKEECECGCHYGKASIEHEMNEVEHCILKRMFNSVKRFSAQK